MRCSAVPGRFRTTRSKNQKGLQTEICNPLIYLVRLAGIEPTTPWFVAKYSIQLSYSRVKRNYSTTTTRFGSSRFFYPLRVTRSRMINR